MAQHIEHAGEGHWDEGYTGDRTTGVTYTFVIGPVALILFGWNERAPEDPEIGCRVDLQHAYVEHVGSFSAVDTIECRGPIWRGDFFKAENGPDGNTDGTHYHLHFQGQEPDESWEVDEKLTANPLTWFEQQLADFPAFLGLAGAPELASQIKQSDVDPAIPIILAAARACLPADVLARLS